MTKLKVYGYGGCDTCRKALKFLEARGVAYESVDITKTPPTPSELRAMAERLGDFRKLFNTSGQVYREMSLGAKVKTMSPEEAVRLLAGNGRLVKRPFVVWENGGLVGFREDAWGKALEGRNR